VVITGLHAAMDWNAREKSVYIRWREPNAPREERIVAVMERNVAPASNVMGPSALLKRSRRVPKRVMIVVITGFHVAVK